ncbi:MAG: PAS domain S-box protein [Desulfobacula sp.]|uniref:PAS domain S-box protein n=1 Tax=Desulfobacula sp. TaxID=2593537 RepID=UPI001D8D3999|nr:PAS domain S-box protein [Desulfobacula sp.]MBT5547364.1 PAS domain S-box protein [Desulfobacula sp.]
MEKVSLNILIVDDSSEDREKIQRLLKGNSFYVYNLLHADTGEKGLSVCRSMKTDCILLDYRLPDMDGLEFMDELGDIKTSIILLTGKGSEKVAVKAMKAGASDYLVKDDLGTDLLARSIQYAIERRQTEDELYQYRQHLEELVKERTAELKKTNKHLRQEIKERKLSEATLQESEKKYRRLFDNVPVGLYRTAPDGSILDANPSLIKLLGYPDQESVMKMNAASFYVNLEDRTRWKAEIEKKGALTDWEIQLCRPDGEHIWVNMSCHAFKDCDQKVRYYEGSVKDITAQKKAEQNIRQQNIILQGINKVMMEALTCENQYEVANICLSVAEDLTKSRFGFIGEVNNEGLFDTIAISNPGWDTCQMPDSKATILTKNMAIRGLDRMIIVHGKSRIVNNPASHPDRVGFPDGHPEVTCFLGIPLKQGKKTIGIIGLGNKESGYDKADQKTVETLASTFTAALKHRQMETRMQESEERFRSMCDTAKDAVIMIDNEANISYWNTSAQNIFGYSVKEVMGKKLHPLIVPHHYHEAYTVGFDEFKTTGKGPGIGKTLEFELMKKDGAIFPVELSVSATKLKGKWNVVGILRDISERRRKNQALKKSNRALKVLSDCNTILIHAESEQELLKDICRVIVDVGRYPMAWIGFARQNKEIYPVAQKGFEKNDFNKMNLNWEDTESDLCPIGAAIQTGKVFVCENLLDDPTCAALRPEAKRFGYASLVAFPLVADKNSFGVLNIYAKESDAFNDKEIKLLSELSKDLTFGIVTLRTRSERDKVKQKLEQTLENLRKSMGATIQVMASTVEIRDPYTAGHQKRVTTIARAIATEMNLPEDKIAGIRMAGIIHDLGKIAVPAEILSKPGKISGAEFSIIKGHPQVAYDLLKDVDFPWPIASIIWQHHERMDGSGYPHGLAGEDILPEARIIAVADVVEAMASHRPYRAALGIETALEEISRNKGTFYDPEVADACLTLFKEKGFKIE